MNQKLTVGDKTYVIDIDKAIQSGAAKQIRPYRIGQIFCLKSLHLKPEGELAILTLVGINLVCFVLLTDLKNVNNLGNRWRDGIKVQNLRNISDEELSKMGVTYEYVGEGADLPTILAEFYAQYNKVKEQ